MDGCSSEVVMLDLDDTPKESTMDSNDVEFKQISPQPPRRLFSGQGFLPHSPSSGSLHLPNSGSSSPLSNLGPDADRMCKRKSSISAAPNSGKRPARKSTQSVEKLSLEDVFDSDTDLCPLKWVCAFLRMPGADQERALCELVERCSLPQVRLLQHHITPFFQKDFLSCLPPEIALFIVSLLGPRDMAMAARTCQHWRTLCEEEALWKESCLEAGITEEDVPSVRIEGEWKKPANGHGITIFDHMTADESFVARREKERVHGTCFKRCEWKARYLRHCRIVSNWKCRPIAASCILRGHEDHVITCLQIRGDVLVTGSDDNTLKVWSISTASLRFTLTGHVGGVWSSQLSDDGKYIVSGSTDRTVRVWSAEDGSQLHILQGHTSTVRCMALHGKTLVSGSRDMSLRVWDIESGECLRVLLGHVAAVRCVQFDGKRVVSGAYDFTVKVWLVETGECIHSLTGHSNRVYSLLLDSERSLVVSGSLDTTIRVWDIERGVCTATLVGHQSLTSGMQLRGDILVSGNADSTVRIWDISDGGQCLHQLTGPQGHRSAVTSLQFLSSNLVATSSDDGCVKLWDSGGSGGCIWRLKATDTLLACAVGSRNGTEDTKLILVDFDAAFP